MCDSHGVFYILYSTHMENITHIEINDATSLSIVFIDDDYSSEL